MSGSAAAPSCRAKRLVEADIIREQPTATRSPCMKASTAVGERRVVTIEEFRGASVKRFTHDDLRQMYRARMALEGMAAAWTSRRLTTRSQTDACTRSRPS